MGVVSRQLTVNIVLATTWKQLLQGVGGVAYTVPSSGSNPRADIKMIRAANLSGGSTQVEIAFSTSSTPIDGQLIAPRRTLPAYGLLVDDSVHVLRSLEGIWARAVNSSGSTNVVVRASILEIT